MNPLIENLVKNTDLPETIMLEDTVSYTALTGSIGIFQGYGTPSQHVGVNATSYNEGGLQFYWDRSGNKVYWLQYLDLDTMDEIWSEFPSDVDSLNHIGLLVEIQKLYWFISDDDPVNYINSPTLFNGTFGMFWWKRSTSELYKLISYNPDGTNLIWEVIVNIYIGVPSDTNLYTIVSSEIKE